MRFFTEIWNSKKVKDEDKKLKLRILLDLDGARLIWKIKFGCKKNEEFK